MDPPCERLSAAGFLCVASAVINATGSNWLLDGDSWTGVHSLAACDPRATRVGSDRALCVTAVNGDWQEGWDACKDESCYEPCERMTKDGKRCLSRWNLNGSIVAHCTTANVISAAEWCATADSGDWRDGWGWCASGCVANSLPPPAPPSSPPAPYGRCQRRTKWNVRCLDSWHFKGQVFHQCTRNDSSTGEPWCMTYDEYGMSRGLSKRDSVWGWCAPGCVDDLAAADECHRTTLSGAPCEREWAYDNHRHVGCIREDSGFEWCMLPTREHWGFSRLQKGLDWDYCAKGCAPMSPPPPSASPEPEWHSPSSAHQRGSANTRSRVVHLGIFAAVCACAFLCAMQFRARMALRMEKLIDVRVESSCSKRWTSHHEAVGTPGEGAEGQPSSSVPSPEDRDASLVSPSSVHTAVEEEEEKTRWAPQGARQRQVDTLEQEAVAPSAD